MSECKRVHTPMNSSSFLYFKDRTPFEDVTLYRDTVSKLQYLSFTRPDISFVVNKLSQYMHDTTQTRRSSIKLLMLYLQHSRNYGLKITRNTSPGLFIYSDVDWASEINNRTSTFGNILYFGQNTLSWCKNQLIVTHSSPETEYYVVAFSLTKVNWVQKLLSELHVHLP